MSRPTPQVAKTHGFARHRGPDQERHCAVRIPLPKWPSTTAAQDSEYAPARRVPDVFPRPLFSLQGNLTSRRWLGDRQ